MSRILNYVTVGCTLLILYLGQEFLDIRWEYLDELQSGETYKRYSGFVLGGFMLLQWSLTVVKVVNRWSEHSYLFTQIHKWMGAISPLIFYFHAMRFGFAYLFFLSVSLFQYGFGLVEYR